MEEMNLNTAVTSAEQCLLDDTNFNPVEQHNIEPNNPPASQASFHKDHTLALLEDLPRDESENALSEVQSPLFIHVAAPTVSSENLLIPKGTVNGPVSHPASPTSSVNEDGVSLTTGQSAGQHKDPSMAAHEPSQPAVEQSFKSNHITDVAHSNDLSHSINQLPTSDSPVSCEMQNCSDNDLKIDTSLAPQNELCQDTKSELEKEEGAKLLTEVSGASDAPISGNGDSTKDPQQDPVVNNEEVTATPQIVRTEKRRKRKMDVSQITRYNPEDMYNDMNDSPKDAELLNMDRLTQSDELLRVEPQEYSLKKVKSEPMFDEFGVSYSEEIVETVEDYRYSPASRFIDDASPNDFSLTDDDHIYNKSNDQESFYPCTKCNVNFREKKHLHRHMMYHLDGNNHFRHLNIPRPYACKECGRTFRDQTSRLKHMEIHQERRERLMEEIRELRELQDEGRTARLQCPQCVFGTNCPKTFVQHAKTHEKDKQYYCCDECTFMAVSEPELECHRYVTHKVKMKSSMLDFEMSQRKAQRKLSERSTFLLPSKKSPVFMCNLCPFNTSARNILRKHMEYLHPASCTDQLDDRVLDDRESDITSELLDFGSQAKQFLKQSTFPKNSVLKPDLKRPYDSSSHTSGFKLFPRKQYNFQITKRDAQARYFPQSSPNKTILVKNDQTPGYFNQIAKQKANYKLSSSYLYKEECERYGLTKNVSRPYSMNFKKEDGNPVTSERLISNQGKMQNNGVLLDSHNVHAKRSDFSRDHNRAAMQGVKKIKREEADAEEDLGNYSEFLDLLQKFDPSENKESFDTEDESSWGNGELGDYDSKSKEDKVSNNINQPHSEAHPHFRKVNDQKIDNEGNQSSQFKEDYYFEYYDDPEDSFLHELHVDEHLDGAETGLQNHNSIFDWADLSLEKKNCPYCPAIFETGVGLSNHVRGHLHRAGLTYEARHVVSPERIVTNDKVQRFKRIATPIKRIRKAIEKSESPSEHTCQLCGGWFDTKIGLSNHVRGHLKRLGKTKWDAQKSPICVLNEMLQDEVKCEKILKALNTRHVLHRPFSSRKFASGEDFSATALPLEAHHNGLQTEATSAQVLQGLPLSPGLNGIKPDLGSETSHTLIELLKNKQLAGATSPDNSPQKNQGQTARKRFNQKCVLPINEDCTLMYQPRAQVDFSGMAAKLRTCAHCNSTFTSAVSLSNHLRAYARRKSHGILTGTVVECKQKRSRSGSKKKGLPLPHSADEVYILRCRFCGLVFKGPLSVQEDWIKHLQRHIVNANLPRTGAGMVEIPSLLKKPPSISETSFSLIVAETAS